MDRKYNGDLATIVTKAPFSQGTLYNIFRLGHQEAIRHLNKKLEDYSRQKGVEVVEVYRGINKIANGVIALAIDRANEGVDVDFKSLLD